MGVNTTGLLNTQTEVYASYKNDAVTKNETAAKKDSTAKTEEKNEPFNLSTFILFIPKERFAEST